MGVTGVPVARETAIVIGAGIAGLAASRPLADRFRQVVLVDRDRLPDEPAPRRGTPQSSHGHVLLGAGQRALDELFPGLTGKLLATGAVPFDPGSDLRIFRNGTLWASHPLGLTLVSMSRPLLERELRRRVAALPNVEIRDEIAVSGLTGDGFRVTGVRLDDGRELPADLVVDCSGRGSRSDRWLSALGMPTPEVEEVRVGVCYATRIFRRKPADMADGLGAFCIPTAPLEKRVGLALAIEDDRWLVGLGGWHGACAPGDEEGYLRQARELPYAGIARLIERAEPLTDIVNYQFPSSRRRRFERLAAPPGGYLAMGDAVCSFNPIYGQGMTCAAMEALDLGRVLDRPDGGSFDLAREFYRAVAKTIAVPWRFAVGADFNWPETTGPRPRGIRLSNAYSSRLLLLAQHDPEVRRVFTTVQHLISPPAVLFAPWVVARVLRGPRAADRSGRISRR